MYYDCEYAYVCAKKNRIRIRASAVIGTLSGWIPRAESGGAGHVVETWSEKKSACACMEDMIAVMNIDTHTYMYLHISIYLCVCACVYIHA